MEKNPGDMTEILAGHHTMETAYIVDDYPYGFRLRCKIRYWMEFNPKKGFRLWSQTTNPTRGDAWNKPKASIYSLVAGCMILDGEKHVTWTSLSEYADTIECKDWRTKYGAGLTPQTLARLDDWIARRERYDARDKTATVTVNGVETKRYIIRGTKS